MGNAYGFDQATMDGSVFASRDLPSDKRASENYILHENPWVVPLAMGNAYGFDQATMDGSVLASRGSPQRQKAR